MDGLLLDSHVTELDPARIFGRVAPLEVDLGCGDGSFLVEQARLEPARNFLGIERLRGRVATTSRKIERLELGNARVLQLESSYAVGHLLPAESVATFHLLFPDPWPKRRHHRRRVVTPEFLAGVFRALEINGALRVVTDDLDYFCAIKRTTDAHFGFAVEAGGAETYPITTFERHFRKADRPIHRLLLRKISPDK